MLCCDAKEFIVHRNINTYKQMQLRTLTIMKDGKFGEFRSGFSFNNFEVHFSDNIPQPPYYVDCCVYVMKFLKVISLGHTLAFLVSVTSMLT